MAYRAYDPRDTRSHARPVDPNEDGGYDSTGTAHTDGYVPGDGVYPAVYPHSVISQLGREYDDLDTRDPYHTGSHSAPYIRPRHGASSMSRSHLRTRPPHDNYATGGSGTTVIKFKRLGGVRSGITLGEAVYGTHLSKNDYYSLYDLNADARGRIILKIRWTGYSSMTYELPADSYDGRVELQTLARRIARACVHFIQANMIHVSWDRVVFYQLEEIGPGKWQPVLSSS